MSHDYLSSMIEVAQEAATIICEVYETAFSVNYKAPKDPVTAADTRANEFICRRLRERHPGIPIVAEESDPESFSGFRKAERVFFVDPLDGTREFVARNGEFVVMIGLLEGQRPTCGVVQAPARETVWAGSVGHGAFKLTPDGQRSPLRVSSTTALEETRVVVSRSRRSEPLERAVKACRARELVPLGSAGLKGAAVAEGTADIYLSPNRAGWRWDTCAVDALIHAAGGIFTDAHGVPYDYRAESLENTRGIAAANPVLHPGVLLGMAEARE